MKGQQKLSMRIIFESVLIPYCRLPKIIKISLCLSKLQLAKAFFGAFIETQCNFSWDLASQTVCVGVCNFRGSARRRSQSRYKRI